MSVKSKLAGKLPGDELINGLDSHASTLADRWEAEDPNNPAAVLVIAVVRVRKVEHLASDDGRIRVPTLEVSRIEALGLIGQEPMRNLQLASVAHQKLLLDAAEERTGASPLPIDAVSVDEAGIDIEVYDD